MSQQLKKWLSALDRVEEKLTQVPDFRQYGKLTRATGLVMEAVGLKLPIGALCIVERQTEQGI
ncbi:TPA: flagellum-specific ATP synthase FliI, partial [Enterobacter cloacae]|nr:flagellum-specific ATP synthase FliI [Enterobacter cloacae]